MIKDELLTQPSLWKRFRLCPILLGLIALLSVFGLVILYSAARQSHIVLIKQSIHFILSFLVLLVLAQVPISRYKNWSFTSYLLGLTLLIIVIIAGKIGKGAQRWLDLGFFRIQPSELMKLVMPMTLAWFLSKQPLPIKLKPALIGMLLLLFPCAIIFKQPDLGTAIMVFLAGATVIFFAGIRYRIIISFLMMVILTLPLAWHYLHDYQKQRVLTFLAPERDPLGSGYHIIQSKIAIGSGGLFGKGWLNGSQAYLHFLPEHKTDFIFAVCGEEFGLIGCTLLFLLIVAITYRCLLIANQAESTYAKLLGVGIAMNFFLSSFVNAGMVTGLLPVVGVPLPLVSYGGSSLLMIFAGFGIMMAIHQDKPFFAK